MRELTESGGISTAMRASVAVAITEAPPEQGFFYAQQE
jgi:hypothetical protein